SSLRVEQRSQESRLPQHDDGGGLRSRRRGRPGFDASPKRIMIDHKPLMMHGEMTACCSLRVHQNLDFAKDDACLAVAPPPPARCCNGTNVARSTADVGEAVLSTSSSAAAFSSVHRDNG